MQRAVDAAVGDGEGAALHVLDAELAVARPLAEIRHLRLDLGEAHAVGLAHHRHDEAAVGADGNADVVVVLVDDLVAVDLGVDGGDFLQGLQARLHEEAHEAQLHAVALLEQHLVFVAQLHHCAHVDVVERRQDGGGVLRVLEALRDGLAQPRHAHAFFARRVVGRRRYAELVRRDGHGREARAPAATMRPAARGAGAGSSGSGALALAAGTSSLRI